MMMKIALLCVVCTLNWNLVKLDDVNPAVTTFSQAQIDAVTKALTQIKCIPGTSDTVLDGISKCLTTNNPIYVGDFTTAVNGPCASSLPSGVSATPGSLAAVCKANTGHGADKVISCAVLKVGKQPNLGNIMKCAPK